MSRVAAASDGVRYAAQSLGRTPTCTRRSSICVPVGPTTRAAASPRTLGWRRRRGALVSRRVTTGEDTETEVTKDNSEQTRLGERVVGVAGGMVIPQKIIDAERAANPLRRPRLLVYCLAACVAAAQATSTYLTPPADIDTVGEILFLDFSVMLLGAGLWRAELSTRATQLQRIWKEAEYRANSLERAEAGLGDTLWTARVRKDKSLDGKSNESGERKD